MQTTCRESSVKTKRLLVANKLDVNQIPSMKLVKKQKQIISLQLHPDKLGDVSEEEKQAKQEELKKCNVENEKLQNYLLENKLFEVEEQDEEFELDDELADEENKRIKKKGCRSGIMFIGLKTQRSSSLCV